MGEQTLWTVVNFSTPRRNLNTCRIHHYTQWVKKKLHQILRNYCSNCYAWVLLQISWRTQPWKNFENQPTYIEVTNECIVAVFWLTVYILVSQQLHQSWAISDNPWSRMVYNFSRFRMSVCLSDDNFRKPWRRKSIFAHLVHLVIWVKFVYEGHRFKVMVTWAVNVRCYPATPALQSEHDYNCPDSACIASLKGGM